MIQLCLLWSHLARPCGLIVYGPPCISKFLHWYKSSLQRIVITYEIVDNLPAFLVYTLRNDPDCLRSSQLTELRQDRYWVNVSTRGGNTWAVGLEQEEGTLGGVVNGYAGVGFTGCIAQDSQYLTDYFHYIGQHHRFQWWQNGKEIQFLLSKTHTESPGVRYKSYTS